MTAWNKIQNETSHNVLQNLQSKTKDFITIKIHNSYYFSVSLKPKTNYLNIPQQNCDQRSIALITQIRLVFFLY